jgi:hypothetical protein
LPHGAADSEMIGDKKQKYIFFAKKNKNIDIDSKYWAKYSVAKIIIKIKSQILLLTSRQK